MWLYASRWTIIAASAVSLLLLLWAATGRNPFVELFGALRNLWRDNRFRLALGAALALCLIDRAETSLDPHFTRMVPWDFTYEVSRVGADLLLALQRLEWAPLTHGLTFVYVILWTVFMLLSLIVYVSRNDWEALKRLLTAYMLNYAVALPFYAFVPVKEAWAANMGIRFLIPTVYPRFEVDVRPYSGLDNCFPSLHTSLALTYALVAWRNGYRRLAIVLTAGAGLVMLSTLYLGVHWVIDMAAGVLLAVAASGYLPSLAPTTWSPSTAVATGPGQAGSRRPAGPHRSSP